MRWIWSIATSRGKVSFGDAAGNVFRLRHLGTTVALGTVVYLWVNDTLHQVERGRSEPGDTIDLDISEARAAFRRDYPGDRSVLGWRCRVEWMSPAGKPGAQVHRQGTHQDRTPPP